MKFKLPEPKNGECFAWHPVITQDDEFVWLEKVHRFVVESGYDLGYVYRTIKDDH